MADDFCIDESAGIAYLTTHRENTIDCVSLNPAKNSYRFIVAGDPLNEELIEPSSAAWGRLPGEYGSVAYVSPPMAVPLPPCPMVCDGRPGSCAWSSQKRQKLFGPKDRRAGLICFVQIGGGHVHGTDETQ
jgi:hypothetical protein